MTSISKLGQFITCPSSFAYPQRRGGANQYAGDGNTRHAFLYDVGSGMPRADALAKHDAAGRELLECMELDGVPLGKPWQHELAIAVDVANVSARILGTNINRAYDAASLAARGVEPLSPTEVPGTLDTVLLDADCVRYCDHKSAGVQIPARKSYQMRVGVLGCMLLTGATRGQIAHIIWHEDGHHAWDGPHDVEFSQLIGDLDAVHKAFGYAAQAAAAIRAGMEPNVYPSIYCRYCDAVLSCPESKRMFALVTQPHQGALHPGVRDLAAAFASNPAKGHELIKQADTVLKAVKEVRTQHVLQSGNIALGDGNMYGQHTVDRELLDGAVSFDVISATLGVDVALTLVKMTVTKSAIEEAARIGVAAGKFKSVAAGKRQLLSSIEESGGVNVSKQVRLEEFYEVDDRTRSG